MKIFITMALFFSICFGLQVAMAASPDGTTITTSSGSITDALGTVWTLGAVVPVATNPDCSPKSCGSVVVKAGTPLTGTAANLLLWFNSKIYQSNAAGLWWQWTGTGWLKVAGDPRPTGPPPPPPPPPPTLAAASFVCTPVFQPVTMSTFVPAGATGLQFSILNQSKAAMTISAVATSTPEFQVSGLTLPTTVAAGATQVVTIKFVPKAVGTYTGTVTFTANVNNGSFSMGVVGVAQ